MKTKYLLCLTVLSTVFLLFPLAAGARESLHSVHIDSALQVGGSQLKLGNYRVEWQGAAPVVQVSFQQNGKTRLTVPATLKTADNEAMHDAVMTDKASTDILTLKEIDFGRQRESLVFGQNSGGM